MSRILKQIIYGALYLIVAGAIVYGLLSLNIFSAPSCFDNKQNQKEEGIDCGGPCVPCAIKNLQPLRSKIETFGIDGNTNAVITLANPNFDYGAESFAYTVNFYNQQKDKIFSLSKTSFIYPAEAQKTIIEPNLRISSLSIAGSPELIIGNINWKPAAEFPEPKVQIRQVKTEVSGSQAAITGILVNRESFSLTRAGVGALVYQNLPDGTTRLVGASKTVLQNLQPLEERAFNIPVPLAAALTRPEIDPILSTEAQR